MHLMARREGVRGSDATLPPCKEVLSAPPSRQGGARARSERLTCRGFSLFSLYDLHVALLPYGPRHSAAVRVRARAATAAQHTRAVVVYVVACWVHSPLHLFLGGDVSVRRSRMNELLKTVTPHGPTDLPRFGGEACLADGRAASTQVQTRKHDAQIIDTIEAKTTRLK